MPNSTSAYASGSDFTGALFRVLVTILMNVYCRCMITLRRTESTEKSPLAATADASGLELLRRKTKRRMRMVGRLQQRSQWRLEHGGECMRARREDRRQQ